MKPSYKLSVAEIRPTDDNTGHFYPKKFLPGNLFKELLGMGKPRLDHLVISERQGELGEQIGMVLVRNGEIMAPAIHSHRTNRFTTE